MNHQAANTHRAASSTDVTTDGTALLAAPQVEVRDVLVGGLFSVRYPSGLTTYYFRTGREHGRKRIRLGTSKDLSLGAARIKAYECKMAENPMVFAKSVKAVAAEYITAGRLNQKRTADLDQTRIELYVLPAIGQKRVSKVTQDEVASIVRHVHASSSDATRNRIVSLLRALFNFAIKRGYCSVNPTREMRMLREKPRTIPTVDDALITKLHLSISHLQQRAPQVADLVKLLLLTGLRIGEALSLHWDDLNQLAGQVYVRTSKTKPRPVPLNAHALSLLSEMHARRGNNQFVFQRSTERAPIDRPYRIMKRAFTDSGLPTDFCAHSCRHVFATLAVQQGVPLYTLTKLLGHASPTTTLRYAEMGHQNLVEASNQAIAPFAAKELA